MKHIGNLEITKSNAQNYKDLVEVTGDLSIYSKAELEALESVGGDLSIDSNAELKALKSVGGNLSIDSNAELEAPKLESVGGNLSIDSNAIEQFPNNVKIKCLRQICGNIGRMKFELIDGIACTVLSAKSKDGLTIKRCRKSVFRDGGLIGDAFFVASNDKNNAHGKTMKEAIDELHFKEMSRDVKKYRGMALTTKKSPQDWGLIYRAITGACNYGTKMFMEERKLKKTYTLKEILKETQGAYGSDKFREVING